MNSISPPLLGILVVTIGIVNLVCIILAAYLQEMRLVRVSHWFREIMNAIEPCSKPSVVQYTRELRKYFTAKHNEEALMLVAALEKQLLPRKRIPKPTSLS